MLIFMTKYYLRHREYPERFVAFAWEVETRRKVADGIEPLSIKVCAEELDGALSTGMFVGTSEGLPALFMDFAMKYFEISSIL
jgi:hypothetical protein